MHDYYPKKESKSFITYHVPVNNLIGAVARQLVRKFIGMKTKVK